MSMQPAQSHRAPSSEKHHGWFNILHPELKILNFGKKGPGLFILYWTLQDV